MSEIKLALGCGWRIYGEDWVHIDGGDYKHLDSKDITCLDYKDNSVDVIYASHVLEYFDREDARAVLDEWYRVLKPEGTLWFNIGDTYGGSGAGHWKKPHEDSQSKSLQKGMLPTSYCPSPRETKHLAKSLLDVPHLLSTKMIYDQAWIKRKLLN